MSAAARHGCLQRVWGTGRALAQLAGELDGVALPSETLAPAELKRRFGPELHQQLIGRVRLPAATPSAALLQAAAEAARPLVALEEVQDPQNLGAVFRAAAGLGAAGIVVTKQRSAPLSAAVARASAGTLWAVPWASVGGLPNWLMQQVTLSAVATVARGGQPPWRLPLAEPVVLVFGREGRGLKPLTARRCHARLTVPLVRADSLNVAQTVAAVLVEAVRQRETNAV